MIAIKVGMMILLFFVISWIISHFGINPERGGRPPIDRRVVRARAVMIGALFHVCDSDKVVVVELAINSMNMVEVMMI